MGDLYRRGGKRVLDVLGAAGALVITAPVLVVAAVAVRREMGSPVFFRQCRPGLGGREFSLLKLRTMRASRPDEDPLSSDAERLSPLGTRLRSTSTDELPELWNVLRGDMSLVGPRPLLSQYLPRYTAHQARRHEVRPGMTGWAQVHGRNEITWDEKLALDVWYVDNVSLGLDLKILWRTVGLVLRRKGINAEGHATAPEFEG